MKNKFILIGAVLVAVVAIIFVYVPHEQPSSQIVSAQSLQTVSTSSPRTGPVALFKIDGKTYSISVTPGETVLAAMETLASTSDFAFTGRNYPGLGTFVDSINGRKNTAGMYWILYINEVSATGGASSLGIKENDIVEWKYEKGY